MWCKYKSRKIRDTCKLEVSLPYCRLSSSAIRLISVAATNRVVIRVESFFTETGRHRGTAREQILQFVLWNCLWANAAREEKQEHNWTRFRTIISRLFLLDYRVYTFFAESWKKNMTIWTSSRTAEHTAQKQDISGQRRTSGHPI